MGTACTVNGLKLQVTTLQRMLEIASLSFRLMAAHSRESGVTALAQASGMENGAVIKSKETAS